MDVDITEMPELRVGLIRTDMEHIRDAWARLNEAAGAAGLLGKDGVTTASIMPVEAVKGASVGPPWLAAAVVVPGDAHVPAGLTEERLPASRYARAVHTGSFEGLAGAWAQFAGEALPASGHQPGEGVCLEIYRTGPEEGAEGETRTELYIPIA